MSDDTFSYVGLAKPDQDGQGRACCDAVHRIVSFELDLPADAFAVRVDSYINVTQAVVYQAPIRTRNLRGSLSQWGGAGKFSAVYLYQLLPRLCAYFEDAIPTPFPPMEPQ
jgi:hypothetical protein